MLPCEELKTFLKIIKRKSGYDFTDYSEKSIQRRVDKILVDYNLSIEELTEKVTKEQDFIEKIVKKITVNTTEMFRDTELWVGLKYNLLPYINKKRSIYIWHAGCSTGQEVYSMLILLNELDMLDKVRVYATDLNTDVIEKAKKGEYRYSFNFNYLDNFDKVLKKNPYNFEDEKECSYEKYFDINRKKDTLTVKQFLRDKAVFVKHDLCSGNNIFYSKFDIIFCRNVIIYFNTLLQNRVLEMLSTHLYNEGYLILGAHETIVGQQLNNFEKTKGIYRKKTMM